MPGNLKNSIIRLLTFAPRSLHSWLQHQRMRLRAYIRFGLLLPPGAVIAHADNVTIGSRFGISPNCYILCQDPTNGSSLHIGNNVLLNLSVMINADCGGVIRIGDNVLIGPNVVIRAADHRFSDIDRLIVEQGHVAGTIDIGDDVWIGANAVILANVRIGKGAVIGAGSVVVGDLPEYSVAVGAPARVIRSRG